MGNNPQLTDLPNTKLAEDSFWNTKRDEGQLIDTRTELLVAAYEEIQNAGFQSASINHILKRTGVTKGALYHHFPSKAQLGYAVLDELIHEQIQQFWIEPLANGNPIDALINIIQESGKQMTLEDIRLGCPLSNLSQEMSPVDESFRRKIETLYSKWRSGLASALKRGQHAGEVNQSLNTEETAVLIVASLDGCMASAKNAQSQDLLMQCTQSLIAFLNTLRTP